MIVKKYFNQMNHYWNKEKVLLFLIQVALLGLANLKNEQLNIFDTVPLHDGNFIVQNFSWFLFYICGIVYFIDPIGHQLKDANPMIVIRSLKRQALSQEALMQTAIAMVFYPLIFNFVEFILNWGKLNSLFLMKETLSLMVSFGAFSLLILVMQLIAGFTLTRFFEFHWLLIAAGFKSVFLINLTTTHFWFTGLISLVWLLALAILLMVLNRNVETL